MAPFIFIAVQQKWPPHPLVKNSHQERRDLTAGSLLGQTTGKIHTDKNDPEAAQAGHVWNLL